MSVQSDEMTVHEKTVGYITAPGKVPISSEWTVAPRYQSLLLTDELRPCGRTRAGRRRWTARVIVKSPWPAAGPVTGHLAIFSTFSGGPPSASASWRSTIFPKI